MPDYPVIHGVKFCPQWRETFGRLPKEIQVEAETVIPGMIGKIVRAGSEFTKLQGYADVPIWTVPVSKDGRYIASFSMMDTCAFLRRIGIFQIIEDDPG